ncbi:hypothetical protein BRC86_07115 [Halobacteriales archaeon QS_3_64_16]|nr:MAG: hypothetical protein BRC86_07115 [Halobacteriales archaeon QS_3_64_16]
MIHTDTDSESERERTDGIEKDNTGGTNGGSESAVGRQELLAASGSLSAALAGCVGSGPGGRR